MNQMTRREGTRICMLKADCILMVMIDITRLPFLVYVNNKANVIFGFVSYAQRCISVSLYF